MYKTILFVCLFAVALAQYDSHHHHDVDYHAPPHYKFEYSVHDPHTHDVKKQEETREGKLTKGFYTLQEADGKSHRNVHYVIDSQPIKTYGHGHY